MAQVDFFLKIDGIKGESTDHKHKDEIDIESWSFGETNSGGHGIGGGGGAGKVVIQDFHCTTKVSVASNNLFLKCAGGDHIAKAVLTVRKAGKEQQEYLVYTLTDLLVSSYQIGGSSGGDPRPTEQFSLNFSKIEFDYKKQDEKGGLGGSNKAGWNVKTNKQV